MAGIRCLKICWQTTSNDRSNPMPRRISYRQVISFRRSCSACPVPACVSPAGQGSSAGLLFLLVMRTFIARIQLVGRAASMPFRIRPGRIKAGKASGFLDGHRLLPFFCGAGKFRKPTCTNYAEFFGFCAILFGFHGPSNGNGRETNVGFPYYCIEIDHTIKRV
jgi:hypothetical protein